MKRSGKILIKKEFAGLVWQDDDGYGFAYDPSYIESGKSTPVSLTMPIREKPYLSKTMLPFFDGLIPEGWLLDITVKNWKLDANDRMKLLLTVCKDCIGSVSVEPINAGEEE
ncbi:MAG: HipA N-terminal domain-containing protein [Bacteroidota bacterium]